LSRVQYEARQVLRVDQGLALQKWWRFMDD